MTCGTQAMVRPAMIRFRSISDMADLSRSVVNDWRQIAAERADPVTASNRDRITPQIHILLDQPGVPRSCFIEGGGSTTGKLAAAANSNLQAPARPRHHPSRAVRGAGNGAITQGG